MMKKKLIHQQKKHLKRKKLIFFFSSLAFSPLLRAYATFLHLFLFSLFSAFLPFQLVFLLIPKISFRTQISEKTTR